ncbi:MAG: hypothetical protein WC919_00815 [Candidatus Paceibacterota bacterium]|jgi:hypothetical protein
MTPIAHPKRVVENGKACMRWTIKGHKGLFAFRVIAGMRQHGMNDEVLARFPAITGDRYIEAYFRPVDQPAQVFVEKIRLRGKSYIRISWAGNIHYIQGNKWTAKVEQEARDICKQRHMHSVAFYAEV